MIDIDLVREHLKADDEDVEEELLQSYIASALSICEGYCNRKFYESAEDAAEDRAVAMGELNAAIAARDEELSETEGCEAYNAVNDGWIIRIGAIKRRLNGTVMDGTTDAAWLKVVGHLYTVREDNPEIPAAAKRILEPYLWIGDLA